MLPSTYELGPLKSKRNMMDISYTGLGNGVRGRIRGRIARNLACVALIQIGWKERNFKIFEDIVIKPE